MIYDRKTILSMKLRSTMQLRKLTRVEMLSRMQVFRLVEPLTQSLYHDILWDQFRNQHGDAPHGRPWHVSFHASQFPGDDPMACSRQSLYRMMDFAQDAPPNRMLTVTAAAGKGVETELVSKWHAAGILLSAPPDDPIQTGFEVEEARMTGSVDSVILPPGWNKPLPVEIKSKFHRVIELMKVGAQGPDSNHVTQIKAQLGLVRAAQESGELWADLDPVDHGVIFYLSRDNPIHTAEFRVDYDPKFFEQGLARLKEWSKLFDEDILPSPVLGTKHPMGWRWSYPPCQFCNYKKTCKLDHEQKIFTLSESVGVNRTQRHRPDYDPAKARWRVAKTWADVAESAKIQSSSDVPERGATVSNSADSA